MSDFVSRHGLWTGAQEEAGADIAERIAKLGTVRFAFSDAHGVVRGKTLIAADAIGALRSGVTCTLTMLLKDLSGRTAFPVFQRGGNGAGDMVMVADPTTFRVLPWSPHSGWILCDLYGTDGTPHPFSTRALMRRMLAQLDERSLAWRAGLEVEFHVLKLAEGIAAQDHIAMPGPPPKVIPLNHGYQYLTEQRYDAIEPLMETLRSNLQELGLPLRSLEIEFGPSQVEVTFGATTGMQPADLMLLFRSATKQIFARAGYLASFMCRPQLPHIASSGWHLHHWLKMLMGTICFRIRTGYRSWHAAGWADCCNMQPRQLRSAHQRSTATSAICRTRWRRITLYGPMIIGRRWCALSASPAMPARGWKTASGNRPQIRISTWPRRLPRVWMASRQPLIPGRRPTHLIVPMHPCCQRA